MTPRSVRRARRRTALPRRRCTRGRPRPGSAQPGTHRTSLLSTLRPHSPHKSATQIYLLWETLSGLSRPGRARTAASTSAAQNVRSVGLQWPQMLKSFRRRVVNFISGYPCKYTKRRLNDFNVHTYLATAVGLRARGHELVTRRRC